MLEGFDYCFVYLDDIQVASNMEEDHKVHLEEVLRQLQQHGLVLHLAKGMFFASSLAAGAHVAAIQRHPRPSTKSQLMSFLGMLNF